MSFRDTLMVFLIVLTGIGSGESRADEGDSY